MHANAGTCAAAALTTTATHAGTAAAAAQRDPGWGDDQRAQATRGDNQRTQAARADGRCTGGAGGGQARDTSLALAEHADGRWLALPPNPDPNPSPSPSPSPSTKPKPEPKPKPNPNLNPDPNTNTSPSPSQVASRAPRAAVCARRLPRVCPRPRCSASYPPARGARGGRPRGSGRSGGDQKEIRGRSGGGRPRARACAAHC